MNSFFTFLKDLIEASKERLKTPITRNFLFTFLFYNWRPILFIIFSKASIEDKIIIINHEYCKPDALLYPFLIAIFYTIGVNYLMWGSDLISTKSIFGRKKLSNDSKINILDSDIKVAVKLLELEEAKTDYKERKELVDQINDLKNKFTDEQSKKESLSLIIDRQNSNINEITKEGEKNNKLIESIFNLNEPINGFLYINESGTASVLSIEEYKNIIGKYNKSKILEYLEVNSFDPKENTNGLVLISHLINHNLLKLNNGVYYKTAKGVFVKEKINKEF